MWSVDKFQSSNSETFDQILNFPSLVWQTWIPTQISYSSFLELGISPFLNSLYNFILCHFKSHDLNPPLCQQCEVNLISIFLILFYSTDFASSFYFDISSGSVFMFVLNLYSLLINTVGVFQRPPQLALFCWKVVNCRYNIKININISQAE